MFKKWLRNLGVRAVNVLGLPVVLKMWRASLQCLPQIFTERNLHPLDHKMSDGTIYTIHHRLGKFKVDPKTIDQIIPEYSTCFSAVRELYIKDCYLRYHNFRPEEIRTVIDLGANRGMASLMFIPVATTIIAVEMSPQYREAISYNLRELNGFSNFHIVNKFICNAEMAKTDTTKYTSFADLIREFAVESIDFLKMDIEGGEFDIIDELPFERISYISMEVHHHSGNVGELIATLKSNGFSLILTNNNMDITNDPMEADYVFARNTKRVESGLIVAHN